MGVAVQTPLIEARGLEHRFPNGTLAVSGVDFSVQPGEFVSLVGPSGCGKSTLLRLVAGLLPVREGTLRVGGEGSSPPGRDGIRRGFVFQSPNLLPWRTVEGNLLLPLELEGVPKREAMERSREWIARVGLSEFARAWPAELSGGMRMRASIARALASRPRILLMDEPFAALDDIVRSSLQEELLALRAREGFVTLFVTHNVAEAVFLSDRVLVLSPRPGRVAGAVAVPFGNDRTSDLRGDPEFARLTRSVTHLLREAAP